MYRDHNIGYMNILINIEIYCKMIVVINLRGKAHEILLRMWIKG